MKLWGSSLKVRSSIQEHLLSEPFAQCSLIIAQFQNQQKIVITLGDIINMIQSGQVSTIGASPCQTLVSYKIHIDNKDDLNTKWFALVNDVSVFDSFINSLEVSSCVIPLLYLLIQNT